MALSLIQCCGERECSALLHLFSTSSIVLHSWKSNYKTLTLGSSWFFFLRLNFGNDNKTVFCLFQMLQSCCCIAASSPPFQFIGRYAFSWWRGSSTVDTNNLFVVFQKWHLKRLLGLQDLYLASTVGGSRCFNHLAHVLPLSLERVISCYFFDAMVFLIFSLPIWSNWSRCHFICENGQHFTTGNNFYMHRRWANLYAQRPHLIFEKTAVSGH